MANEKQANNDIVIHCNGVLEENWENAVSKVF